MFLCGIQNVVHFLCRGLFLFIFRLFADFSSAFSIFYIERRHAAPPAIISHILLDNKANIVPALQLPVMANFGCILPAPNATNVNVGMVFAVCSLYSVDSVAQ